jgi:general secretion pathway protein D
LFFQKVGPRTILVATGNRRTNFQQLVLRTFYLANANPKDVKTIITSAIPAQPGRSQTIVIEDATTNSLTIRDTEENVRLFAKLISSLDKDRAEVVMDVAIYEVNKTIFRK